MFRLSCLVLLLAAGVLAASEAPAPLLVFDAGGHTAAVNKVQFTPDGQRLISVSNDKTIRVWDVRTGEPLNTLRPPIGNGSAGMLFALAVSPDGRWLAAGGYESTGHDHGIYLIDLSANEINTVLRGHTNVILDLSFSANGRWLASASADKTARLWNLSTAQSEAVTRGHGGSVYAVRFSPDSASLATASLDGTACVWALPAGDRKTVLRAPAGGLQAVAWSNSGTKIAGGGVDQSIGVWTPNGELLQRFEGLGNHVTSLCFTRNDRELFYTLGGPGNQDGGYFINLATNQKRLVVTPHENSVLHGSLSPDGTLAATADANGEIVIWNTANGVVSHRLKSRAKRPWSVAWDRESEAIAWGNASAYQQPNDRGPLECVFQIRELDFVPLQHANLDRAQTHNQTLTTRLADDRTMAIDGPGRSQVLLKLPSQYDQIRCYTLLGDTTAVVGSDFGLSVFDARDGRQLRALQGHAGAVWAVAPSASGRYVLSAADDQTLRIWPPGASQPLLSLFFADRQWIAWTPEGYYAASPGGEQLMGWQVNNGQDKFAEFYPAARFRGSLYRPDIVRRLLDSGSVQAALAGTDRDPRRPAEPTTIEQVLPPEVRIVQPATRQTEVSEPRVAIRASVQVRGRHPVTSLRLLLDGRPHEGLKGVQVVPLSPQETAADVQRDWQVELTPGRHSLVVMAETAVSKGLSEPIELLYREPGTSEQPLLPNLNVFAVGISNYAGRLKLEFAAKDAQQFVDKLKASSTPLFRTVNVRLITDAEATRHNVLAGWTWLRRESTQRDVSVFFYSGHGAKDEAGGFYFVPVDGDPKDLLATSVSGNQFKDALGAIPGRVLVLLDACHAGAAGSERRKATGGLADDLVRDLVTDDYGAVVMCSSMGGEYSMESEEHQQGYFTLALLEAFAGKADYNHDGFVYLTEVDAYLAERIKELTHGQQHSVTVKPATIRSFPLSKL